MNPFVRIALMQATQQQQRPHQGFASPLFLATGQVEAPKPRVYEISSCFDGPRGMVYQILNILATMPGVGFEYTITGQTGWLFKRLYVRYKMTGEKQRIEHAQRWLISLGKEDSAD